MVSVGVSNLGCTDCSSWNLGWRSTANITGMFCWWRRCCQRSGGCQATSSSSSRTAPRSTSSKGHHCVAATWNTKLHWTRSLASKLTRLQSSWLQNVGSNTGTRLPDSNTELRRVEVAPHRCVGRVEAECHWQSYWTVAAKAESLCPSEGTSLRTSY